MTEPQGQPAPTDVTVTAPAASTVTYTAPNDPAATPAKQETDWKAEARKWEQRAKENQPKAQQFDELQEAAKTEQQKLAERAEKAERAAAEREVSLARYEVAASTGLDPKLVKFLPAGSREEMQQAAEELLHATVLKGGRPAPDPSQGTQQPDDSSEFDRLFSRPIPPT